MCRLVADVEHALVVQGHCQTFSPKNALRRVGIDATNERLQGSFSATTQDNHQVAERELLLAAHEIFEELIAAVCLGIARTIAEGGEDTLVQRRLHRLRVWDNTR